MLRNFAALSIALPVCLLMLPKETAVAQQVGKTGLSALAISFIYDVEVIFFVRRLAAPL